MTDILPRDLLLYAGGDAWKRFGTFTRRAHRIQRGGEGQQETVARADSTTCATYFGLDGLIHTAAANVMRPHWIDTNADGIVDTQVALLEGSATNVALWCRDLTNAAWTKSGSMTAAKNQTGIDGIANSASSLTAGAANQTCLQAVTLASSARAQSCYVKRLTGSGTINMTTDGGATWTAITVTAAWTRVSIPTQTLANPSLGFQIVTNGDAIAVDYVQNETGAYSTSAIATTSSAVTRAADSGTIPIGFDPPTVGAAITVYFKVYPAWLPALADGLSPGILGLGCDTGGIVADGKVLADIFHGTPAGTLGARLVANGVAASVQPTYSQASPIEGVMQISPTGASHQIIVTLSDGTTATGSAIVVAGLAWRQIQLEIGNRSNGGTSGNMGYQRVMVVAGMHSLAECQAVP